MADAWLRRLVYLMGHPRSTRKRIARHYAHVIRLWHADRDVDIRAVNLAILARYRPSGLDYIKRLAWTRYLQEGRDG